jgi:pilus assembly protein TadC
MKKIFLVLSILFLGSFNFSHAKDEVEIIDDSKPSISIEFNNFDKLGEEAKEIEKQFEGKDIQINYSGRGEIGNIIGFGLFFLFLFLAISVFCLVFWILMLVHAISKPIKQKAVWILIILLFGIIGALVYYFAVKRDFDKKSEKVEEPVSAEKLD